MSTTAANVSEIAPPARSTPPASPGTPMDRTPSVQTALDVKLEPASPFSPYSGGIKSQKIKLTRSSSFLRASEVMKPKSPQAEPTHKNMAILTSGGDSQGMNAAVRAVVQCGLYQEVDVFLISEGYQGLVDGGKYIRKATSASVNSIIEYGGTCIGSSRCQSFRTREGRLLAAANIITAGIQALVVIGGDGSLTGANIFRTEWKSLVEELVATKKVNADALQNFPFLTVVGMVGSIDNDMCGTDLTIGADSALHRIVEAVDNLVATASSHQRAFVVEVMGRNCGYLALMAGIATGADFVLVPESPPMDPWGEQVSEAVKQNRTRGKRHSIVLVAEGATDVSGNKIKAGDIKKVLEEKLQVDTRVTILGHVQRGGAPSAQDRNLGTRLGAGAVEAVRNAQDGDEAVLIGMVHNRVVQSPLMGNINTNARLARAMEEKDWTTAVALRGPDFKSMSQLQARLAHCAAPYITCDKPHTPQADKSFKVGVMFSGAPAPGMNACLRVLVRTGISNGCHVIGIKNSFDGFMAGEYSEMQWSDVHGCAISGGCILGTNRSEIDTNRLEELARHFAISGIQALVIVGGYYAYSGARTLSELRAKYQVFNVPIIVIPASISNNVPGTELSLGCDTALNVIVELDDRLKQSASSTRRRVFVVEVMGGYCGYLVVLAGLAGGANHVFLPENGIRLKTVQETVSKLVDHFNSAADVGGLVIVGEKASELYTARLISEILNQEAPKGSFDSRCTVLGHLQQGGRPSPWDRVFGARFAATAFTRIQEILGDDVEGRLHGFPCEMVGIRHGELRSTPFAQLKESADDAHRCMSKKEAWWLDLTDLLSILAEDHTQDDDE